MGDVQGRHEDGCQASEVRGFGAELKLQSRRWSMCKGAFYVDLGSTGRVLLPD